jgi:pimeloyl-ACP methyl ester carboxylesterase
MEFVVRGKRAFAATGGKAFDPAKPAVVFVHGAGGDHTVWSLQTRYFAHHGRSVLAVDLPGHGRSEGPPCKSIGDMADWLIEALASVKAGPATLVGHSMGSMVALEVAVRAPDKVAKLALLGTSYPMAVSKDLLEPAAANDPLAQDLLASWSHSRIGHAGGQDTPGLWIMGGMLRTLGRAAPGVIHADLSACNVYDGAPAAAAKISCPVLFLLGARDMMTPPRKAADFAKGFKDARIVSLPEAGHMFMAERPGETLDALKAFA